MIQVKFEIQKYKFNKKKVFATKSQKQCCCACENMALNCFIFMEFCKKLKKKILKPTHDFCQNVRHEMIRKNAKKSLMCVLVCFFFCMIVEKI